MRDTQTLFSMDLADGDGTPLSLPAIWRAYVAWLLEERWHALSSWELNTLSLWELRPDHVLSGRQAALLRRVVEEQRRVAAAEARRAAAQIARWGAELQHGDGGRR